MLSVSTHQQHPVNQNLFSLWGDNKDHQDQQLALEVHLLELDPLSPSDPNHSFWQEKDFKKLKTTKAYAVVDNEL